MPQKILILGGGFGGLYAALELEKSLAKAKDVEVTLVSRENFFLFVPMLHEVAASDLDITNIVSPIRKLLKRVHFFEGEVHSIDVEHKEVIVSHGMESHKHLLKYDHLILALGGITNFYNLPGVEDSALTMKSLGDAIYLRNRLIANLEAADFECYEKKSTPHLTVVVTGGGFAGVETIAAINDFMREAAEYYPNIDKKLLRVVLVHGGQVILPELSESLGRYAQEVLAKRGVEVHLGKNATGYYSDGVHLDDGTIIPTKTLIWTAGIAPNPLLESLPCKKVKGRIVVNSYLQVPDYPGLWAVGDCAIVPDMKAGKPYPPTAQHALREGVVCAHNIICEIDNKSKVSHQQKGQQPFSYQMQGQLAALGKRCAVANILGFNLSGFLAWIAWRTIYLAKLPTLEKKIRVSLDWALDLFFTKDIVQYMTIRSKSST